MKILALETMGRLGSVATLIDDAVVGEKMLESGRRTAQTITPAIGELLGESGWKPSDLGLIAVVTGPGSFTGLRIGVTTAKVLAYAAGSDVIGVDAMEVIAAQTPTDRQRVAVVVGAERQQFFSKTFTHDANNRWVAAESLQVVDMDEWLATRRAGDFVTGPGLAKVADRLPDGLVAAEPAAWEARAATVGEIGFRRYEQGQRDDLWSLLPDYGRRSAAEEKSDANDASTGN